MNSHLKIWLTVLVGGLVSEAAVIGHAHPEWTPWLAPLVTMIVGLAAGYGITPPTVSATMARLKSVAGADASKRGFASLHLLLVVLGVCMLAFCGLVAIEGCGAGGLPPAVATDIQVGLKAAVCIIDDSTADIASGMSIPATVVDVGTRCGASLAQVASLFDAEASRAAKLGDTTGAARYAALATAAHNAAAGQ